MVNFNLFLYKSLYSAKQRRKQQSLSKRFVRNCKVNFVLPQCSEALRSPRLDQPWIKITSSQAFGTLLPNQRDVRSRTAIHQGKSSYGLLPCGLFDNPNQNAILSAANYPLVWRLLLAEVDFGPWQLWARREVRSKGRIPPKGQGRRFATQVNKS